MQLGVHLIHSTENALSEQFTLAKHDLSFLQEARPTLRFGQLLGKLVFEGLISTLDRIKRNKRREKRRRGEEEKRRRGEEEKREEEKRRRGEERREDDKRGE